MKIYDKDYAHSGPIDDWEDLMISAAIILRVLHFFLLSRTIEKTQNMMIAIDT